MVPHLPPRYPVNDVIGLGIPLLDEDFDPSEPLPQDIDATFDEDYSYE